VRARLLGALAGLAVLAGCADEAETSEPNPTDRSVLEFAPLPEELDIGQVDSTCALLDEAQRDRLGLAVLTPDPPRGCELGTDEDPHKVRIGVENPALDRLVSGCTELRDENECETWTADTIEDYPIIRAPSDSGFGVLCQIYLGVTERTSILILDTEAHEGGPDCTLADGIAAAILATLR
jgi:hypothetical protein